MCEISYDEPKYKALIGVHFDVLFEIRLEEPGSETESRASAGFVSIN